MHSDTFVSPNLKPLFFDCPGRKFPSRIMALLNSFDVRPLPVLQQSVYLGPNFLAGLLGRASQCIKHGAELDGWIFKLAVTVGPIFRAKEVGEQRIMNFIFSSHSLAVSLHHLKPDSQTVCRCKYTSTVNIANVHHKISEQTKKNSSIGELLGFFRVAVFRTDIFISEIDIDNCWVIMSFNYKKNY